MNKKNIFIALNEFEEKHGNPPTSFKERWKQKIAKQLCHHRCSTHNAKVPMTHCSVLNFSRENPNKVQSAKPEGTCGGK
jgi:hypothetical protein